MVHFLTKLWVLFSTILLNLHNNGTSFLVPFLVNTFFKFRKLFKQQNFLRMRIFKVTYSFPFSETRLELAPFCDFLSQFTRFFVLIFIQDIMKNAYYHIHITHFGTMGFEAEGLIYKMKISLKN